jgi:threonine dehydrogenase-like Zn-dependent dehydrogenase
MLAYRLLQPQTQPEFQEVDSTEARLKLAREHGADDVVPSGPDAPKHIRELSGGVGASVHIRV